MGKQNCWEFKMCGRQPDGPRVAELGACPAATLTKANGVHDGKNGGRSCWAIAGTLCGGEVQGMHAQKVGSCMACDFYKMVVREEGKNLMATRQILAAVS